MTEKDCKCKVRLPLFKFLEREKADWLLNSGSIRLTKIDEFRNQEKYADQIHDNLEGKFFIENYFDSYNGLAKNGNGLIPFFFYPYHEVSCKEGTLKKEFTFDNALLYCTSDELFSESLLQAYNDKKDACVMITDPDNFFDIITKNSPELSFVGYTTCDYETSKYISEKNPGENSITNKILINPFNSVWIKPKEFINQRENRAVWIPKNYEEKLESIVKESAELKKYVIDICISNINRDFIKRQVNNQIGIEIKKIGKPSGLVLMQYPNEILSPVIIITDDMPNRPYLGFINSGKMEPRIEGVYVYQCDILTWTTTFGQAFFLNFLDEIERITFYTIDNPKDLNQKFKVVYLGTFDILFEHENIKVNITFLNNLEYPRYLGFLDKHIDDKGAPQILITRKIKEGGISWECEKNSSIQNDKLANLIGDAIDGFYES